MNVYGLWLRKIIKFSNFLMHMEQVIRYESSIFSIKLTNAKSSPNHALKYCSHNKPQYTFLGLAT